MGPEKQEERLFVSLNLCSETRHNLAMVGSEFCEISAGWDIKWTAVGNIHITLKFLGEIHTSRRDAVLGSVQAVVTDRRSSCFEIRGLGAFPPRGVPRVIWAGVVEPEPSIQELVQALESSLSDRGFPREKRDFTPHVTIGRARSGGRTRSGRKRSKPGFDSTIGARPREALRSFLETNRDRFFGAETVEAISVMRSELRPDGPRYEEIERFLLEKP